MAEVLKSYGITTPLVILPTGIELERFAGGDGARFRAGYGIPLQRPVMLHVGRVAFEKNIGFLLRVLRRVRAEPPEALLIIAGEGPAVQSLRREALGVFDNLLFVGNMDRATGLLDCYRAANVKVFLTYRNPGAGAAGGDGARRAGGVYRNHGHPGRAAAGLRCAGGGRGRGVMRRVRAAGAARSRPGAATR